jgi:aminoglycoside phosphotransferase (APT) family kinase protein
MPAEPPPRLVAWLSDVLDDPGPFRLSRLSGGNSNETYRLDGDSGRWILRRPPAVGIAPSAHSMEREHRVLAGLADEPVPTPKVAAFCADAAVSSAPILIMEYMAGEPLTDRWPSSWPDDVGGAGRAVIEALAALHRVDWVAAGLADFGRPEGFLARQVPRWRAQWERCRCRELPLFEDVAGWLESNVPPESPAALLHGDFHLDNTLIVAEPQLRVNAIIDWEMATIGDPMLDLGLLLAFWGTDRPDPPAMPKVQAVTRVEQAPSRLELAAHYAHLSGRSTAHLNWYLALAFFKLAAIVEGAYAQFLRGELSSDYARGLADDVPILLAEAARFAELGGG